jgi:hypothetical protein
MGEQRIVEHLAQALEPAAGAGAIVFAVNDVAHRGRFKPIPGEHDMMLQN